MFLTYARGGQGLSGLGTVTSADGLALFRGGPTEQGLQELLIVPTKRGNILRVTDWDDIIRPLKPKGEPVEELGDLAVRLKGGRIITGSADAGEKAVTKAGRMHVGALHHADIFDFIAKRWGQKAANGGKSGFVTTKGRFILSSELHKFTEESKKITGFKSLDEVVADLEKQGIEVAIVKNGLGGGQDVLVINQARSYCLCKTAWACGDGAHGGADASTGGRGTIADRRATSSGRAYSRRERYCGAQAQVRRP